MTDKTFAAAINCIDGRTQLPVIEWLRRRYGVDYVDMITQPGPERLLAEGKDVAAIESLRKMIEIFITRHNASLIAIVGHHDCAGNPTGEETQREQIVKAIKILQSCNLDVEVIGLLWVDENWQICKVL